MHCQLLKFSLCFFVFLFSLFGVVKAESLAPKLGVSPHTFELEVKRGQLIEEEIKIINQSEVAIPIATEVTDFTAEEESGQMIFDKSSQDPSFASRFWFEFENPNFILDPGEMEKVRFSIRVPENAEPGGHYATVLFKPQLPSYYFEEGQPRIIPTIGVLFLFSVRVEGLTRPETPLTIVEFNIPENLHLKRMENFMAGAFGVFTEVRAAGEKLFSIVETSHLPFALRIKNNDIYHIKPSGKLAIYPGKFQEGASGKAVGETEIRKTTILPGKVRSFPVEFKPELPEILTKYLPASISNFISRNLLWGKYTAALELNTKLHEKDYKTIQNIEFWVFPWKVGLFLLLIFSLTGFFVVKYRQRLRRAVKVLLKSYPQP